MQELIDVFYVIAQVFVFCGAIMFMICFILGAIAVWQMFKLSLYAVQMTHKWNRYKRLPLEGRHEADKSGKFPREEDNVK